MRGLVKVLVLGALIAAGSVARADTLDYKFSGVEDELCGISPAGCAVQTVEFKISSPPAVMESDGTSFTPTLGSIEFVPHPTMVGGFVNVVFYKSTLAFIDSDDLMDASPNDTFFVSSGTPLFTGVPSSPTLLSGISTQADEYLNESSYNLSGTLTVTDLSTATTPEPSSLVMLGTGVVGAMGMMRRRLLRG